MPYKKGGEAEQRAKIRRTAKRRIARLEKEIAKTGSDKERYFYQQQIGTLREQISMTYERNPYTHKATGYSRDELRMAAQNLKRTNVTSLLGTSNQQRRNFITQQELNRAESYQFIGPVQGEFTSEEVQIFYRATQEAWEGLPSSADRNRAILEYYGETDLRSFVNKVLDMNERARNIAHEGVPERYADEGELAADEMESDRDGSSDFLAYVVSPTQYDALTSYIKRPETE